MTGQFLECILAVGVISSLLFHGCFCFSSASETFQEFHSQAISKNLLIDLVCLSNKLISLFMMHPPNCLIDLTVVSVSSIGRGSSITNGS